MKLPKFPFTIQNTTEEVITKLKNNSYEFCKDIEEDEKIFNVILDDTEFIEDMFRNSYKYNKIKLEKFNYTIDISKFLSSSIKEKLVDFVYRKSRNPYIRSIVKKIIFSENELNLNNKIIKILFDSYFTSIDYLITFVCGIKDYYRDSEKIQMNLDSKEQFNEIIEKIKYGLTLLGN